MTFAVADLGVPHGAYFSQFREFVFFFGRFAKYRVDPPWGLFTINPVFTTDLVSEEASFATLQVQPSNPSQH